MWVDEWMDGWIDGCGVDGWDRMDVQMDVDGWMVGVGGCVVGWMDVWLAGWMDG